MHRPNALVFVRRNGLIVTGKHVSPARFNFDEQTVKNLEVLDAPELIKQCEQFFGAQSLGHRKVLMVLDQDITFEKILPAGKPPSKEALDAFIAAMPFEMGKRAGFSVAVDDTTRLYGANAELFTALRTALLTVDAKVIAITPLALYGLEPGQQLKNVVSKLLHDKSVRKQADFVHGAPV